MKDFDWYFTLIIILIIVSFVGLFILMAPMGDKSIVYSTYEEGFEISHMETAGRHFIISARNDNDSFSITVDSATYAKFIVNDVIHVKVTVYESKGEYYKEYKIMGREGFV